MTIALRQSTASQEIPLGIFVDSLDGTTAETGLTIANTDIKIWKSGATTLANKNSGGATHISGGIYYAVLDATDTDTVGGMIIFCAVSGALAVRLECQVYEEEVFDDLFAASAVGYLKPAIAGRDLDITSSGTIQYVEEVDIVSNVSSVAGLAAGAIVAASFAAGAIDAAALATDAVTEIQSGLATAAALTTVDTVVDAIKVKTDYLPSATAGAAGGVFIAGSNAATSITTALTANITGNLSGSVGSVTGNVGGNVVGDVQGTVDELVVPIALIDSNVDALIVSVGALNDISVAEVEGTLTAIHLDHLFATDYDPASKPGTATALLNELIESDSGVSRFSANSLEQAPSGGGGGTTDWTADERTALRTILGVPASGTTPDAPSAGALKVIDDFLDSEIAAIKAKTDNLPASPAATGDAMTLATDAVSAAALSSGAVDEILDEVVEDTITVRQALRAILAMMNKTTRSGSTIYFRDVADTKNRLAITIDSNADRTAVVRDLT